MTQPTSKSVVLIGGGHTHALVLNGLKAAPLAGANVTVINPGKTAPYSGMLPGFVAGHYTRKALDIDLAALCHKVGATLIDGKAIAMDLVKKHVQLENGTELPYDLAAVDVGITSKMDKLPGFKDHGVPAKPLGNFSEMWDAFRQSGGPKHVTIIGGGIAGAELAMAMAFALRHHHAPVSVKLLDRGKVLSANSTGTQKRICKELVLNNVEVMEGVDVARVTATGLTMADGSALDANFVVGAAGATPHAWTRDTGLTLHDGFIAVDKFLQTSTTGVFAVGDCAHMTFDPRPKAGVYAVRQAPILLRNLRNTLSGQALEEYSPQADYLKLVSLGGKRAFGEKNGLGVAGHLIWRLKDRIDQSFMKQF